MPVRPNAVYTVNVSVVQLTKNNKKKIAQKIVKFSQIISLTDRTKNRNSVRKGYQIIKIIQVKQLLANQVSDEHENYKQNNLKRMLNLQIWIN